MSYQEIRSLTTGKLTRRMLLGIANLCYDRLGLLAPFTVQIKIELRDLYRKELGWIMIFLQRKRRTGLDYS